MRFGEPLYGAPSSGPPVDPKPQQAGLSRRSRPVGKSTMAEGQLYFSLLAAGVTAREPSSFLLFDRASLHKRMRQSPASKP
jgi:hypothetical protein